MLRSRAACAATLFTLLFCSGARSQTVPTTLYVRFEIIPSEAKFALNDVKAVEKQITQRLLPELSERFPWQFKAGSTTDYPRLDIRLEHVQDWSIRLLLVPSSAAASKEVGQILLWKRGDVESRELPAEAQWAGKIADALERDLFQPEAPRLSMFAALRVVPLGVRMNGREAVGVPPGQPANDVALVVLPLDYNQFRNWSRCEYKLRYLSAGGNVPVEVTSIGTGQPFAYPPQQRQFDGILVRLDPKDDAQLKQQIPQLLKSVPVVFYIVRIEDEDPFTSMIPGPQ